MKLEILKIKEKIEIALELGESHYREFKSALEGEPNKKTLRDLKEISKDIGKTLVAFANSDGGELLVGVEDSGVVTGINMPAGKLEILLDAPRNYVHEDTPLPNFKSRIINYKGFQLLYFGVPKGNEYVYLTSDGRCLQRRDLESVPIAAEQIIFNREEVNSKQYDREFIQNAVFTDLDIELISNICSQLSIKVTPEKFLQHLDIADFDGTNLKLKRAALLLFAKNINKWHPRIQVRILKIAGEELKSGEDFNVVHDEEVSDNIINLLEKGWDLIRPHLTETRFSRNAIFKTQIIYPELACREALINAIAHRDYSIEGRGIEIYVFEDRIEFKSPGELLSTIKIADLEALKGVHQSRNSNIAKVLREIGYMRELGEGIRRIFDLMNHYDLAPPNFESSNKTFTISLYQHLIYSKEEKLWLDNFENLELSREQRTVVRLGANGKLLSPNEIWEAVGIVDTDKYRQLLESLGNLGILNRKIDRQRAYFIAKRDKISKKEIKQFEVTIPTIKTKTELKEIESIKIVEKKKVEELIESPKIELDDLDYSTVFVNNIPFDTNEEEMQNFFEQFGPVAYVKIPRNYYNNYIKGYAFIEFDKNESAIKAIKASSKVELKNRKLYIRKLRPKN